MKEQVRRLQVTCWCERYKFPHRIGGGKCSGDLWAESYLRMDGEMCQSCMCYDEHNKTCDVAVGIEFIQYCEGFWEHRLRQPNLRLPISEEERMSALLEERFLLEREDEDLVV